jgi:PAS domain S-box-containing protein
MRSSSAPAELPLHFRQMSRPEAPADSVMLDAIGAGLIVLDRGGQVVCWNRWMEVASGRPGAEVEGKTLPEIFAGCDLRRLLAGVQAATTAGASTLITHALNPLLLPLRTRSGRSLYHDITVAPVGERSYTDVLIFVTDVSMATRREQYLRDQQNARYDAVVASAPDVILTVDEDGAIQFANPAAVRQFQYSAAELLGRDAEALFETKEAWRHTWRGAVEGSSRTEPVELMGFRKDGTRTCLEASASRWKSGARYFVTVILRDINERRAKDEALRQSAGEARRLNQTLEERVQQRTAQLLKTEEALRQSQKMEAIGNLTGGIAHDFNNLLQVISGNLQLLRRDVAGNAAAELRVQKAMDGVSRSAKLSQQLLAFARRQPLAPKVLNLGRFLRDMEDMIRKAVGEGISVEMVVDAGLWNTLLDPGNVENALLNLTINARDAMQGQGRLTIHASNAYLDTEYERTHDEVTRGHYVQIAVTDTGAGMAPDVVKQAFEPFFTTKPEGRGTGLGLSMVYGFVKQSGGHIKIESEVGNGATIRLYLPRSLRPEDRLDNSEAMPVQGGSEMVLVAEDDGDVRETVVAMLNELGYRVLKAKDAQSALTIIESGMPIDLLLTDVVMPGPLKSTDLARKARERMPNLAVLFMSGYPQKAIARSERLDEEIDLLSKPYSRETLARKVRQALKHAAQRRLSYLVEGIGLPAHPQHGTDG